MLLERVFLVSLAVTVSAAVLAAFAGNLAVGIIATLIAAGSSLVAAGSGAGYVRAALSTTGGARAKHRRKVLGSLLMVGVVVLAGLFVYALAQTLGSG